MVVRHDAQHNHLALRPHCHGRAAIHRFFELSDCAHLDSGTTFAFGTFGELRASKTHEHLSSLQKAGRGESRRRLLLGKLKSLVATRPAIFGDPLLIALRQHDLLSVFAVAISVIDIVNLRNLISTMVARVV